MKRLFIVVAIVAILVGITGCENVKEAKLKGEIEAANKKCPMSMGSMGDVLSMKYDDDSKTVKLYYSLNEDIASIDVMRGNKDMMLNLSKLLFGQSQNKELMQMLIDAGAGMSLTYKGTKSGKTCTIDISKDEVKEIRDNPLSETDRKKMILENQITLENSRCPYTVEKGMEMVKVYDNGDFIVYDCRVDENMYDISSIELNLNEVKKSIREFVVSNPIAKEQLSIMLALGKGFTYHYYGDTSGKCVDITFTPDELSRYL